MSLASPLQEGIFLKRYKRFFADIEWKGQVITAHVANTGSLKTCAEPNSPCLFTVNDDPKRKLKYSLEMIQAPSGSWVGINTSLPNQLVKQALAEKMLSHWREWDEVHPEFKINAETRLDFRLRKINPEKHHYIEVKNVTLMRDGQAQFPDSVTTRGQKHLLEMMALIEKGHSAELVFVIQREDCQTFSPADDIDPTYGKLLRQAVNAGLRVTALTASLSRDGVKLSGQSLRTLLS
jgi:sugar fermentation stimulation protein A